MRTFKFSQIFKDGKQSLSSAPFRASSVVIVVLLSFVSVYWSVDEYTKYHSNLEYIKTRYLEESERRLQDETRSIIEFISYRELQEGKNIEQELRDKVHVAYTTASHLYGLFNGKIKDQQLKESIVESLRPIRWDMGKGYYFISDSISDLLVLNAAHPEFEGALIDTLDNKGNYQAFSQITKTRGAGFYRYLTTKPGQGDKLFPKLSFVKTFTPYNWIVGSGMYLDEMTLRTQKSVLSRLREIQFGNNGYFFCINAEGNTIADFDNLRVGRNVENLLDTKGTSYGNEIFRIGNEGLKNGSFTYETFDSEGYPVLRLSHVVNYEPWNWVLVASVELSEMQKAINIEMQRYQDILLRGALLYIVLTCLTIGIIFYIASIHSNRIKEGFDVFTEFFKDTSDKKISHEERAFAYQEFDVLAEYANSMVEERELKDKIIQSNEMRLDTLLGLGRLPGDDPTQFASFVLERLLKILDSEYGYIGLYNKEKGTIEILGVQGKQCSTKIQYPSLPVTGQSLPAKSYRAGKSIIDNYPVADVTGVYPAHMVLRNCLDVAYRDNNAVTMVAGVCNRDGLYTNDDSRQIYLLLEGVWRMLLKTRAKQEMRELRVLLRTIYDSMPSQLVVVDDQCRIMMLNSSASESLGLDIEKVIQKPLFDFFPRLRTWKQAVFEVINTNVATEQRNVPFEQNGVTRHETISVYPLATEGYTGAIIRLDDVTEKVQIEGLMVQSEKMLSVGGLAAGMAHEINNPLAGIMQNLQVVRNRFSGDFSKNQKVAEECNFTVEDLSHYIERRGINELLDSIHESSERAAKLVKNMLSFSRKGNAIYSYEDICDVANSAVTLVLSDFDIRQKVDVDKVEIVTDFAENLPMVSCERVNIQQVLLNILSNGLYALLSNVEKNAHPKIFLRVYQEGKWMVIDIEDNGPGMDAETAKRVFEPFYTTKPVDIGTGLGLSISYFIVNEQHEGSLTVHSALGEGTLFSVRLPIKRHTPIILDGDNQVI